MERWKILFNIIIEVIVFFGVGLLLLFSVPKLIGFFWPFVASWILALCATPLCVFLEKHIKLNKKWASAVIIVLVLGILIAIGYGVISVLGKELRAFLYDFPKHYKALLSVLTDTGDKLSHLVSPISADLGNQIQDVFTGLFSQIGEMLNGFAPIGVGAMGSAATNITNGLLGVVVMFFSAYFFIADREKISNDLKKILPKDIMNTTVKIKNGLVQAMGGFLLAQFKIMGVILVILFIGLTIMRNPYALLLALLISFLDLLPILGTGTVLIPWAVVVILQGNIKLAIYLIILYVICLLTRQLLQPKIIGDSVGLDTLTTLFLIYTGYKLQGMKGMIIALFVGVIVVTLYRGGFFDHKIQKMQKLFQQYKEACDNRK